MMLAVASGKGGTGKTTVAVSLALTLKGPLQYLDCDVEEPNAHLFLKPQIGEVRRVCVPIPEVEEARCTACGACGRACQYHAIVSLRTKPLLFPELCHGCGGCTLACPEEAIREVPREVGVIELGAAGKVVFAGGRLNVGEAMAVPVIRALKAEADGRLLSIVDAPPGTSCPVVACVRGSDFVLLVTEPTPFGLNDLRLSVQMVRALGLPLGVVINRSDIGDGSVKAYCGREGIPVLLEIPESRRVAEAYSRGDPAVEAAPELRESFERLGDRLLGEMQAARAGRGREERIRADV
jgi:MinD superfamily P-loop ATPase